LGGLAAVCVVVNKPKKNKKKKPKQKSALSQRFLLSLFLHFSIVCFSSTSPPFVTQMDKSKQLSEKFKKAVNFIQNLPKDAPYQASASEKLEFYALFKQATEGKCTAKKPSRLNMVAKAKWSIGNCVSFFFFFLPFLFQLLSL
jgi:acyl-CoA-binding protein